MARTYTRIVQFRIFLRLVACLETFLYSYTVFCFVYDTTRVLTVSFICYID